MSTLAIKTQQIVDELLGIFDDTKDTKSSLCALPTDDIKCVCAGCGYIRKAQQCLSYKEKENVFYIIPQDVYNCCLLYVDDAIPFLKMIHNICNTETQYEGIKKIRMESTKPTKTAIQQVIRGCDVPKIIQLTQDHKHPQLQYESLWTLLNITSVPSEFNAYLIKNDAHIYFIKLLKSSPLYQIKHHAMYVQNI